jgi:hypothetical protein
VKCEELILADSGICPVGVRNSSSKFMTYFMMLPV